MVCVRGGRRRSWPWAAPPDTKNVNRRMLSERFRRGNGRRGPLHFAMRLRRGGEMADTPALGAGGRKAVRVRIPLPAPIPITPDRGHTSSNEVAPLTLDSRAV